MNGENHSVNEIRQTDVPFRSGFVQLASLTSLTFHSFSLIENKRVKVMNAVWSNQ